MNAPFYARFIICSITLSLLILGLLITKKLLRKHISIKYQYYIWFVFLLMLLIPFLSIQSHGFGAIFNWFASLNQDHAAALGFSTAKTGMDNVLNNSNWMQDFSVAVSKSSPELLNRALLIVWLAGITLMAILTWIINHKISRIKKSLRPICNEEINTLFNQCRKKAGTDKNISLCCSHMIITPITFGFFKPCIVLPRSFNTDFSDNDLQYIFLHELQHYKHKDILINYIMCAFQIIYWFHPLVWYAFKQMRTDREIACDSFVLDTLEENHYVEYGSTILNFADRTMHHSNFLFSADIGGAKNQIKRRIMNIASFCPETKWMKTKSLLVLVMIASITIASAPILSVRAEKESIYNISNTKVNYEDLSAYFEGYEGSFVLYDSSTGQYEIYNKDNSIKRVSPNSTYKIFSALFGLESGVITDMDSSVRWNESLYPYDSWNKDQTLYTAMKNSVNWYFQAIDNKIGMDKLQAYFDKVNYGNLDLSGGLSRYWLESSLKISPIEQVELLKAFYTNTYGFQEKNIRAVKASLLLSRSNGALLSGKTGTGNVNGKNINGWFIGYVESDKNTYFFATNIQNDDDCTGSAASKITLSILADKQIYTSE